MSSSSYSVAEATDLNVEKFSSLAVQPLDDNAVAGVAVPLGSLLFNNPHGVILQLIRRPGCWFCRGHARELSLLKRKLADSGVHPTLIGIVKEIPNANPKEISDFRAYFPDAALYLDSPKNTYRFMGKNGGFDKYSLFQIFSFRSISHYNSLKGIDGNMTVGEGIIKGGTLVFSSDKKCALKLNEEVGPLQVEKIEIAVRAVHSAAVAAGRTSAAETGVKLSGVQPIADLPKDLQCENNVCKL